MESKHLFSQFLTSILNTSEEALGFGGNQTVSVSFVGVISVGSVVLMLRDPA